MAVRKVRRRELPRQGMFSHTFQVPLNVHIPQNGEIMDPPAQATSSSKRYAQPRSRPASPKSGFQRSLFCPRCIQNQHIVNQALAEYLPSQDDPRCMQFERKIPEYRRKMEADFPQVCETCAPAVEDRIRSTGYAAKTDHLRRMMNRTRGAGITFNSWTWKRVGGVLGTIGWTTGFLGQLCWDLFGALPPTHADDGLPSEDEPQSIATCLISGTLNIQSTPSCNELLQPMLVFTFVLSLLFFWWNPRMQYKLRGGYGRIVGYIEYYKLQLIALAIRYAGWKLMAKDSVVHIDPQATRALHAFSLVAGIMVSDHSNIRCSPTDEFTANRLIFLRHSNRSTAPCIISGKLRAFGCSPLRATDQHYYSADTEKFQLSVETTCRTVPNREACSKAAATSLSTSNATARRG